MLGVMCGASPLPFNTIGFVLGPLHDEFGWSFATISAGVTTFGITAGLLAPIIGAAVDRFGVRRIALGSLLAFALVFAAIGLIPGSLVAWFGLWFLIGLVGMGSTPVTWSRAINMWFYRSRGLALGLLLVGTSLAALIVPKVAVWAIATWGWRGMYPVVALFPLLLALPLGLAWFREPTAAETPAEITASGGLVGVTFAEAAKDRRFWTIWISIALVALAYGGAHIHMPEIIKQHGLTAADGAGIMGMIGIALLSGRIVTGWLLDRIWAPFVCLPILSIPALACWWLMGNGTDQTMVWVSAFLLGFAAGAESDLIAYLASRYFGMANYGKIYGMLYMPFGIFSAISPVLYGRIRDTTGSYDQMLMGATFLFVAGALLLLTLGRYPVFGAREAA
ncbi:MFS transporter [Sandarakinorhabdus cyanobacteriorum]|uniref:MFS transporter n=2 Tax=Sandarakinorhabdus cyanobacteriorum TaxID=1981098 RepID=A0A255Y5C8_9SPHN|nr:MFS transporter [Sandarakinorhabdus cyanobacteriorum]